MKIRMLYRRSRDRFLDWLRTLHLGLVRYWAIERQCHPLPLTDRSVIVFAPHQDDEVFGCGGLIALKCQQNIPVRVVFVTDGKGSHAGYTPAQQAELIQGRKLEAIAALSALGLDPSKIDFLEQPDGELQKLPDSERQDLIQQIVGLLQTYQPQAVYVPHAQDAHIDHEATYSLVKTAISLVDRTSTDRAIELWQYPIWIFWFRALFWNLTLKSIRRPYRLEIRSVQAQKNAAIAVYKSQHQVLPSAFLKQFHLPYEIYFKDDLKLDFSQSRNNGQIIQKG
ncbi:LmbE family protein [Tumidithrix helvetica PCC 7403]|uniref:PIG-L deacetylase family protein n=1 Tax=Tumidithrix helvetica TaxID=3457545 RepID=UPI003CB27D6F